MGIGEIVRIFSQNWVENIFILLGSFSVVYFFLHRYTFAPFDPAFIGIVGIYISLIDITILYYNQLVEFTEYEKIIVYIFIFLLIMYIFSLFFNRYRFGKKLKLFLSIDITSKEKRFFLLIWILAFATTLFFDILMFNTSMGDYRIFLAAKYRIIDIFRQGSMNLIYPLCFCFYYKSKNRKYLYYLLSLAILNAFSGSKGFLLGIISYYFFFRQIRKGERSSILYKWIIPIIGGAAVTIFGAFFSLLRYGRTFEEAAVTLAQRILMASDTYLYAYVYGDYERLYNLYNPIDYIFHPFYCFIGLRGYEYPLGVALFDLAGKGDEGYGPNAIYPVLVSVLGNGDAVVSVFLAIVLASISPLFVNMLDKKVISGGNTINIYYFLVIYFRIFGVYGDLGLWEQSFICVSIVFFMCIVLLRIRFKSGKGELNDKN